MDKNALNRLLERLDDDPDLQALQQQISALEEKIRGVVSEDAWDLVLEWETLWAHYVTLCLEKLQRAPGSSE